MGEVADRVAPDSVPAARAVPAHATGLLPSQAIRALVEAGEIRAARPLAPEQIQPASVDLRLGPVAHRVRASFLPGRQHTVRERIDQFGMHAIDLTRGAVLEKGCVYIVPLLESLSLGPGISGVGNPKSSTGRLDVFTRLITDRAPAFDRVESGYAGPLYAEISPRAFSIVVREGSRLSQLRLRRGSPTYTDDQLWTLHEQFRLVDRAIEPKDIAAGIPFTVDLMGVGDARLVGYRARPHTALIDVDKVNHYDPEAYWEPVHARDGRGMILNPGDFYILASAEAVTIPPAYAAEMVPYDTSVGEFRVHYAGFFDPGFGYSPSGGPGSRAVLEVRAHEVPFLIEHGQVVGRLLYERLTEVPDKLYGQTIGSSYQQQGLRLSKQFKQA